MSIPTERAVAVLLGHQIDRDPGPPLDFGARCSCGWECSWFAPATRPDDPERHVLAMLNNAGIDLRNRG